VRILALSLAAVLIAGGLAAEAQPAPTLIINAPEELAAARTRLASFDRSPLAGIVRMTGLADPGPPIHVILADESSDAAASVSASTAGYAIGDAGLIVLFPSRSPVYPNDTLEDVLRHEVAHVLITRAAQGHPVPRWFHEGFAMAAERPWGLEDRSRLAWELMAGPRLTVGDIDRLFDSDAARPRAYSLSAAMVREILRAHGLDAPAAILRELATGTAFDVAVTKVTGQPMSGVEREFWDRQRVWTVWFSLFTSGDILWLGLIVLAAIAVWRRRKRAAEIRRRWDDEEKAAAELSARSDDPE
jgi:MYXO-CTERM domain-containing protein